MLAFEPNGSQADIQQILDVMQMFTCYKHPTRFTVQRDSNFNAEVQHFLNTGTKILFIFIELFRRGSTLDFLESYIHTL